VLSQTKFNGIASFVIGLFILSPASSSKQKEGGDFLLNCKPLKSLAQLPKLLTL